MFTKGLRNFVSPCELESRLLLSRLSLSLSFLVFSFFTWTKSTPKNPKPTTHNLTRLSSRSCRIPNPSPNHSLTETGLSRLYSLQSLSSSLLLSSSISIHIFPHLYFALFSLFQFTKHLFLSASRKLQSFFVGCGGFSIVIKSSLSPLSASVGGIGASLTLLMIATIDSS